VPHAPPPRSIRPWVGCTDPVKRLLAAFLAAPTSILGVFGVGLLVLVAVIAPEVLGASADKIDPFGSRAPPTWHHLLGTDDLGRDILHRLLVATRLSVGLGVLASVISLVLGIAAGLTAAFLPQRLRPFGLRAIDAAIAFPGIIVAIYILVISGPGWVGPVLGIGFAGSFSIARIVSSLSLSIGGREYILAARALGLSRARLLSRHVLPNIAEILTLAFFLEAAGAIVAISGLSFLGLGIQPPTYVWGTMLADGNAAIYTQPAAALGPAVIILFAALCFNFFGEGMARALNPVTSARRRGAIDPVGPAALDGALGTVIAPIPIDDSDAQEPATMREHTPTSGPSIAPVIAPASTLASPNGNVLVVQNLRVTFPDRDGQALEPVAGVSFHVGAGEIVGIVGESGSGKTLTSLAIAQLVPYPGKIEGSIVFHGQELRGLPRPALDKSLGTGLSLVFQDPMSSLNPALKVGVQLTEGVERHLRLSHSAATQRALDRLREVNIPTAGRLMKHRALELSGGMRQRVMIAMALMGEPDLIIADEPTTALDVTIQAQIMDLLVQVNQDHNAAVILISHNLALVRQICHRVLVMYAGRIVEEIPADRLTVDPLHPYTRALLAAVPDLSQDADEELSRIPGEPPMLTSLPSGCPFHPRCPLAMDRCRVEMPPLVSGASRRRVACWATMGELE
jgi:peptide/nickel transport system permease protein